MQVPPDLVSRARAGDPVAQDALVRDTWPHAYRICRSILRQEPLALDAAQDAMAQVLAHLPRLRVPDAFPGWFYRIAVHAAYTVARDERRHGAFGGSVTSGEGPPKGAPDAAGDTFLAGPRSGQAPDPMGAVDEALDLADAVGRLREPLRTVFLLSYHAGLTSRDIGEILHIPPGTVRYRLAVARDVLSKALDDPQAARVDRAQPDGTDPLRREGGTEP